MKRLAILLVAAALSTASLVAQDAAKLESDAKKAFDSGKFKEAGDKYAKAADSADVPEMSFPATTLRSLWSGRQPLISHQLLSAVPI